MDAATTLSIISSRLGSMLLNDETVAREFGV